MYRKINLIVGFKSLIELLLLSIGTMIETVVPEPIELVRVASPPTRCTRLTIFINPKPSDAEFSDW
jgi:hypothetical protein